MIPRWHIFAGLLFSLFLWILFPSIGFFNLLIIFLSSFLIDFDHYLNAVIGTGKIGLKNAFDYYKKMIEKWTYEKIHGIREKRDMVLFHTIEFHVLILILSFFFPVFIYVLIGMVFHSVSDIIDMTLRDSLYIREYSFFLWLRKKFIKN
jgi:hypothetical protein